ncbi:MAG: hypothetical protein H0V52_11525, partial [Acidimicrobiia bacterium]|nr:hypothetical protein [Acidimicrobiia bacterium]
PRPDPPSGWRPGQVAVVALLALLLGGAGGALLYFLTDNEVADGPDVAAERTTTSTTTPGDPAAPAPSTTEDEPQPMTTAPSGSGRGEVNQGGETAVGNSIFTATYQSNRDRATDDIEVDDDWRIRWDVPAGAVSIEVFDSGGTVVDTIDAEGRGERSFAQGGTYRAEISTDGSRYTVVITDGP